MRYQKSMVREVGFEDDVFEELWLPVGDDKTNDIERLIEQDRIKG